MSGTHLFYNGVLLRDCELRDFGQVIEYDESQTDPLFSRFRITVVSRMVSLHSVNPEEPLPADLTSSQNPLDRQHPSTIAIPEVDGESLVDRLTYIQDALQRPRRDFWFALNAVTHKPLANNQPNIHTPASNPMQNDSYRILLAATGIDDFAAVQGDGSASPGGRVVAGNLSGAWILQTDIPREDVLDFNNGPKPQSVNITKINGGRQVEVQFSIEVCRPLCAYAPADPSVHPIRDAQQVTGVISNRWSIEESLNENWETEITVQGTLRVSDHRFKPDAMRLMTSCALFPYARLNSRSFATSVDGLSLKYRYVLKEAGIAPPPGIIDWTGKYTERVENGANCLGTINVKVRGTHKLPTNIVDFDGQPIANQRRYKLYLTDWLFKIIDSRFAVTKAFDAFPGQRADTIVPIDVVVIENMKEPEVEANVTVRHSSPDLFEGFSLRLHNFGKTIYDATNPLLADWDERDWPIPPAYTWEPRSTDRDKGSAYDGYFQSPCSTWHGKPEGWNREFDLAQREQAAEPVTAQYLYEGGEQNQDIAAAAIPRNPPVPATYGWSDLQTAGFTYLHVEIDNHYHGDEGLLALPLSKQRDANSGSVTGFPETVAFIPIHAGIQQRTFTMVASRQGDWPQVPEPKKIVSNSSQGLQERLRRTDVLPSQPTLGKDGRTWEYSVQVKWEYVLSRPLAAGDAYRASSDPRDKTTPAGNAIAISDFFDTSGAIETT